MNYYEEIESGEMVSTLQIGDFKWYRLLVGNSFKFKVTEYSMDLYNDDYAVCSYNTFPQYIGVDDIYDWLEIFKSIARKRAGRSSPVSVACPIPELEITRQ